MSEARRRSGDSKAGGAGTARRLGTSDRATGVLSVVNGLRRITRALRLAARATQAGSGISAAQLFVLRQLAAGDPMSINALAARTLTDRSSVAAVVDRLVARGLAGRRAAAHDRRRAEVWLTPAGRELLGSAPVEPATMLEAALARLTDAEVEALAGSLACLVAAMGLEATPASMLFEEDPPVAR